MFNMFFNLLAKLLSNDTVLNWLIKYSYDKPYFDLIMRETNSVYMRRWWLMPKWLLRKDKHGNLSPFVDNWLPFSIRLHHFVDKDPGIYLHDHPANYRVIILKGHYYEEDIYGNIHYHSAGTSRKAKAKEFHQIVDISRPTGVWTIFIMGRHCNKWGFLVGGRKVPWRDHLSSQRL